MKRILRWLLLAIVIGLLGATTVGSVYWFARGGRMLAVQTGSMRPLIRPGDVVLVQSAAVSTLQVGDVVSYHNPTQPKELTTHRIIALDLAHQVIVTKGDALKTNDTAIDVRTITGKVSVVLPKAGYVITALHRPLGLLAIVYLPALIVVSYEFNRYAQTRQPSTYRLGVRSSS